MKTKFSTLSLALLCTVLWAGFACADTTEKIIIKLKTHEFAIAETDISNLQVGEAETIYTDNGKTIDLLRTIDGVEIYVDGEMLELPEMGDTGLHEGSHTILHKQTHAECVIDRELDSELECADEMVFFSDGDADVESSFKHIIIIEKDVVTDDL